MGVIDGDDLVELTDDQIIEFGYVNAFFARKFQRAVDIWAEELGGDSS